MKTPTIESKSGQKPKTTIEFLEEDGLVATREKIKKLIKLSLIFATNEDLLLVSKIKTIENLDLSNTEITDISCLSNHKKIEHINLNNTEIKDFSPLLKLTKLKTVSLSCTTADDDLIKSLEDKDVIVYR